MARGLMAVVVAVAVGATSAYGGPRIVVDQPDAIVDATLGIRLEGFPAGQPVEVIATMTTNATEGPGWQSRAVFVTDGAGSVDVSTTAPAAGSYTGVSPMGLFWSMEQQPGERKPAGPDSVLRPWPVTLSATAADGTRAEAALVRRLARAGVTRYEIREAGVVGTLFLPAGGGRRPAIVTLAGSGGGAWEGRAALMASHGYAALALAYFRMPGLPQGLVNIPLEYFESAIRWMRAQSWLGDGFLAVMGVSRGGELALLLGATFSDVNAVIAIVPSGVVMGPFGPSESGDHRPRAAWTYRGTRLPPLHENNRTGDPSLVEQRAGALVESPLYLAWLRDTAAVERSSIRVERTRGPVLLVSGKDDALWPSFALAEIARERLATHRHPFPFLHLAYDGAGHAIYAAHASTMASTVGTHPVNHQRYAYGGSPRANADAAADSWPKILEFLERARRSR
jgi:dienelactone hydrolase